MPEYEISRWLENYFFLAGGIIFCPLDGENRPYTIHLLRKKQFLFNIFLNQKSGRKMSVQSARYFLSTGAVFLSNQRSIQGVNTALIKRK